MAARSVAIADCDVSSGFLRFVHDLTAIGRPPGSACRCPQQRPCMAAARVGYPDFIATRPIRAKEKLVTVGRQLRVIVVRAGGLDAAEQSQRACGEIQTPDVGVEGTPLVHPLWRRCRSADARSSRCPHCRRGFRETSPSGYRKLSCARDAVPGSKDRQRTTNRCVGQPRRAERHSLVERELLRSTSRAVIVVQRQDKDLARASEKSCKGQSGAVTGKFWIDVGPQTLETRWRASVGAWSRSPRRSRSTSRSPHSRTRATCRRASR